MRQAITAGLLCCVLVPAASAQSTISDQPFELIYGSGPWGVLLPSYQLGTDATGAPAFQDDGDTFGGRWELTAIRRFLGTRTSFETTVFYGWAEANSNGTTAAIPTLPNPDTGVNTPLAAGSTHLENSLDHYGVDVALRDTWRTRFGGLSAGAAFSYMAFDQDFDLTYNGGRLLREKVESDLIGGKAILGWDGCLYGRRSKLDVAVGYFDLDVDYAFQGTATVPGSVTAGIEDYATTAEAEFTTYMSLRGYDTGISFGFMYISDLPQVIHDAGVPSSGTTDEAWLIQSMLTIAL